MGEKRQRIPFWHEHKLTQYLFTRGLKSFFFKCSGKLTSLLNEFCDYFVHTWGWRREQAPNILLQMHGPSSPLLIRYSACNARWGDTTRGAAHSITALAPPPDRHFNYCSDSGRSWIRRKNLGVRLIKSFASWLYLLPTQGASYFSASLPAYIPRDDELLHYSSFHD